MTRAQVITPRPAEDSPARPTRIWIAIGVAVLVAVAGISRWFDSAEPPLEAQAPLSVPAGVPAAPGSLGLSLDEVPDLWNSLERSPSVQRGILKNPESGPLDAFHYRFSNTGYLAGAYDPDDESVYALMVTASLHEEFAPNMYLHLCFMLHPYSPECIDNYVEGGLAGEALDHYIGGERSAEWTMGTQVWRLSISQDLLTLRVLAGEGI